jgi:Icc-related predicted phosphoesterase
MKIQILSDLHNEFMYSVREIPVTDADVIVLAGDIDVGLKGVQWAIDISKIHNKPVVYVFGNHEFYHHNMTTVIAESKKLAEGTNVHVLDNDQLIFSGVRFLGTTLWTNFKACGIDKQFKAMNYCWRNINDFEIIRYLGYVFTPEQSRDLHDYNIMWLCKCLSKPFQGKTVIITHHAPSLKSCHRDLSLMSAGFISKLDKLMFKYRINLWIHGHTHEVDDYMIGSTRVVSNQFGYFGGQEVWKFNPTLVIEV